jgi:hypothetical protein
MTESKSNGVHIGGSRPSAPCLCVKVRVEEHIAGAAVQRAHTPLLYSSTPRQFVDVVLRGAVIDF